MKDQHVMNFKPYDAELVSSRNGFILQFDAPIGDNYSRRYKIRLHFDDWWLKYIARLLWRVIQKRRKELENLEEGMQEESE